MRGPQRVDLTGQKFGMLTALKYVGPSAQRNGGKWLWRCDCGTETKARAKDVKFGSTRSCGCLLHAKRTPKGSWKTGAINKGDRFGNLVVTGYAGVIASGAGSFRQYDCRCDCGGETTVRANLLNRGQTKSCGCLARRPAPGSSLLRDVA